MKKLSKMGSATDLPACSETWSPTWDSRFVAHFVVLVLVFVLVLGHSGFGPRPRLSIAPAFRPSSTNFDFFDRNFFSRPFRPISTLTIQLFHRFTLQRFTI